MLENNQKKKEVRYLEQDTKKVEIYKEKIKEIPLSKIAHVDETGIDKCLYREYRRSKRREKIIDRKSGRKYKRTSIVAA